MELRWLVIRRNYDDVFDTKPILQFWSESLKKWIDVDIIEVHPDDYDPEVYEIAGEDKG